MLNVESLSVFYGDAQALENVSLTVKQGAIVAIVGANGRRWPAGRYSGDDPHNRGNASAK